MHEHQMGNQNPVPSFNSVEMVIFELEINSLKTCRQSRVRLFAVFHGIIYIMSIVLGNVRVPR